MLVKAEQKFIRISSRKVRLLVQAIKELSPQNALLKLRFTQKSGAEELYKVIKQAISNAINVKKMDEKKLQFKDILVGEGSTLKRWRPKARGRISPIKKRTCNLRVILED
jgi:large subunit ribosomal protein L22